MIRARYALLAVLSGAGLALMAGAASAPSVSAGGCEGCGGFPKLIADLSNPALVSPLYAPDMLQRVNLAQAVRPTDPCETLGLLMSVSGEVFGLTVGAIVSDWGGATIQGDIAAITAPIDATYACNPIPSAP